MLQPHIQLDETVNAQCALLPGDPARLDRISQFLEDVQELAYNREFRSLRGVYKGMPVLAVSTGIGGKYHDSHWQLWQPPEVCEGGRPGDCQRRGAG